MGDFGDRLRADLKARDWNQADLARALGTDGSQVSRMLNSEMRPSRSRVTRIAEILGQDPAVYLELAGHRREETMQDVVTRAVADAVAPLQAQLDALTLALVERNWERAGEFAERARQRRADRPPAPPRGPRPR